nr:ABC transporter substrate-binding protein [Kineosporia babensis]
MRQFHEQTGIRVVAESATSPTQMLEVVTAEPDAYDLVLATTGMYDSYVSAGLLTAIDESRIPGLDTMIDLGFDWRSTATIDERLYGVVYNWGTQPLAYSPEILTNAAADPYRDDNGVVLDWTILWDKAFEGQVSLFDDVVGVLPMVALAAGVADPYNFTEDDFRTVRQWLKRLVPQVASLASGIDDQTDDFREGTVRLGYLNNIATVASLASDDIPLNVTNTPAAGMPAWTDSYAVTQRGAQHLDEVYEFISHTLKTPWQARLVGQTGNSGVLSYQQAISPAAQDAGLTAEQIASTIIPATQVGEEFFGSLRFYEAVENMERRQQLWAEFTAALG